METNITKKMQLTFLTAGGKTVNIVVNNAKSNATKEEIVESMNTILEQNIFSYDGYDIVSVVEAKLISTEEQVFSVA